MIQYVNHTIPVMQFSQSINQSISRYSILFTFYSKKSEILVISPVDQNIQVFEGGAGEKAGVQAGFVFQSLEGGGFDDSTRKSRWGFNRSTGKRSHIYGRVWWIIEMRACENAWSLPLISETGNFPTREDNFGDFRTKNDNQKNGEFWSNLCFRPLYSKVDELDCCQLLSASPQEKPTTFRSWRPWPKEKQTTKWPLVSRHGFGMIFEQ